MQYAILLYADAAAATGPGNPEWDAALAQHQEFNAVLEERGVAQLGGAALHGVGSATSVRVRDGERLVTDGPFAETREQLWGFRLVDVPDIDAAIALAEGLWEARHGTVEIRPVIPARVPAEA